MPRTKIDVEALVTWALVRQAAHVNESRLSDEWRHLTGGTRSNTGAVEAFLQIGGVRIQGGGSTSVKTPADALTVVGAIDRLPVEAAALIVIAGRTGLPIGWAEEGVGGYVPVLDKRGRHKRRFADEANYRGVIGWEWQWEGLYPDQVDHERLQYMVWWEGLAALRVALDGRLTQWEITGPGRPMEPWGKVGE